MIKTMSRSRYRGVALAVLWLSAFSAAETADPGPATSWVTAWGAPPDSVGPSLASKTVRQISRLSISGSHIRVRLSNLFGGGPLSIGSVRVAVHAGGSAIQRSTDRALTFKGRHEVTIPKGGDALSDSIEFRAMALAQVAVSIHVRDDGGVSTIHGTGLQTAYITSGEATAATDFAVAETDNSRYFLTDIEVAASSGARSVVVLGDSITDGVGSTEDGNTRWPDVLATRLQSDPVFASVAVVNAGISGNRILNDGRRPFIGPSSLSRFDRDVLGKPGVRYVIVLQGSNDISAADMLTSPEDQVSAGQIIDGLKELIARAHARGIRIFGATLLPREGVGKPFVNTDAGRAKRLEVNGWIRTSGAFDAVIDFERLMTDPARPGYLRPSFDRGDHLHPNDAGYAAMASAIDLRLFAADDVARSRAKASPKPPLMK
jgi:lysophospholipase L1-like esterase